MKISIFCRKSVLTQPGKVKKKEKIIYLKSINRPDFKRTGTVFSVRQELNFYLSLRTSQRSSPKAIKVYTQFCSANTAFSLNSQLLPLCILPTVYFPSPYLLHFPLFYLATMLLLLERRAGTAR